MDLLECRNKLDVIDKQIVKLFEERMDICGKVAETKIATGKAVYDAEREKQKLEAVSAMAGSDFNQIAVRELFSRRLPLYREAADIEVNGEQPAPEVARAIREAAKTFERNPG